MVKVLLARNLESLFMIKNSFLNRADIQVFTAETNGDILKIHRQEHADLIATRLDMPGMKCEELFSSIRNSPELRAVSTILVCEDTLDYRERCKQCKVNAVFTLPVDSARLHLQVQQFLDVAPRMFYRAALAVAISGKFKNQPLPFRTENISASGMLISAAEPLAKGDGIFFSFFLSDGAHVSGYGEIIRVELQATTPESFLYGIKFTNIDPEVRSTIDAIAKR
jgi:CheY-like chemotaxis protein